MSSINNKFQRATESVNTFVFIVNYMKSISIFLPSVYTLN